MFATEAKWRVGLSRDLALRRPIAQIAAASVFVALALGMFLVTRRATGALTSPMQPWPLLLTAQSLIVWSWLVRLTVPAATWLTALTVLLFAIACSYPGERALDWVTWLMAGVAILVRPTAMFPPRRRRPNSVTEEVLSREQLLQDFQRYRSEGGRETIRGTLRAEFAPGERQTTLYVGFCPPFERLPDVEAEVTDDSSAIVKLAQVLHNGAQVDVRLPSPSDCKQSVTVNLFASEPADAP